MDECKPLIEVPGPADQWEAEEDEDVALADVARQRGHGRRDCNGTGWNGMSIGTYVGCGTGMVQGATERNETK